MRCAPCVIYHVVDYHDYRENDRADDVAAAGYERSERSDDLAGVRVQENRAGSRYIERQPEYRGDKDDRRKNREFKRFFNIHRDQDGQNRYGETDRHEEIDQEYRHRYDHHYDDQNDGCRQHEFGLTQNAGEKL